jgi:hypothetical protein
LFIFHIDNVEDNTVEREKHNGNPRGINERDFGIYKKEGCYKKREDDKGIFHGLNIRAESVDRVNCSDANKRTFMAFSFVNP